MRSERKDITSLATVKLVLTLLGWLDIPAADKIHRYFQDRNQLALISRERCPNCLQETEKEVLLLQNCFSFDLLFQQEQLTYVSKPLYNHTTKLS